MPSYGKNGESLRKRGIGGCRDTSDLSLSFFFVSLACRFLAFPLLSLLDSFVATLEPGLLTLPVEPLLFLSFLLFLFLIFRCLFTYPPFVLLLLRFCGCSREHPALPVVSRNPAVTQGIQDQKNMIQFLDSPSILMHHWSIMSDSWRAGMFAHRPIVLKISLIAWRGSSLVSIDCLPKACSPLWPSSGVA